MQKVLHRATCIGLNTIPGSGWISVAKVSGRLSSTVRLHHMLEHTPVKRIALRLSCVVLAHPAKLPIVFRIVR